MTQMHLPRLMIAATGSNCGKTMITCGLLNYLKQKKHPVAFKCGPDYIDPMFHQWILGVPSRNLDTFFTDEATTKHLMMQAVLGAQANIALIEGVMGYYDGVGGFSTIASSYELSVKTKTPVILVVNGKGKSMSLVAEIAGFLEFRKDAPIRGVIINHISPMIYGKLKELIEHYLGIRVLGYVPEIEEITMPGRHLGLMMPQEIDGLRTQIDALSKTLARTLDMDAILAIAEGTEDLCSSFNISIPAGKAEPVVKPVKIAVARDEAFCFYYEDNLELLRLLGAEIVPFSPMKDEVLPEGISGIYMGGGYPELHASELSANHSMLQSIKGAIDAGMPCLAECGAFMYLHESMEDNDGRAYKVAGVIPGKAYKVGKLVRFGYTQLTMQKDSILGQAGLSLPAHEFHYWDSDCTDFCCHAKKPLSIRAWDCMYQNPAGNLLAGFPHLYFYAAPEVAKNFLAVAENYRSNR